MASKYKWRATTRYASDTSMSYGVFPSDHTTWQEADIGTSGSGNWSYWYRDANVATGGQYTDANSSRVVIQIAQTWYTSVDERNNLSVRVLTTLTSVARDDLRGSNTNTPGRTITFYEEQGGAVVTSFTDTQLASAHAIYSGAPIIFAQENFTIPPGENLTRTTVFVHNQTIGMTSFDDIHVGVEFMNPLPRNYRPGATLDSEQEYGPVEDGIWMSHNRLNKAAHVLSNTSSMTWKEMRTLGYPTSQGNPPLLLRADDPDSWYNMAEIGKQ